MHTKSAAAALIKNREEWVAAAASSKQTAAAASGNKIKWERKQENCNWDFLAFSFVGT